MATVGVSTERGAARAVLLGGPDANPPGRVLLQREETPPIDDPAGLAAAVEKALAGMSADAAREPGPGYEIDGIAVAYRDEAERHAIADRLAGGRWSGAALVPVSAAHLAAVSSVPFLDKYSTLLVYDAVPGRHTFTVVDSSRSQVLGSDSIVADGDAPVAIGQGIRNAWSLLDSASVEPNGVVLIGSMAEEPGVDQVLRVWFDAPVVAGSNAALSTAIGAAHIARQDAPTEQAGAIGPAAAVGVAGAAGAGAAGPAETRRPSRKALAAVAAGVVGVGVAGLALSGVLSPGNDRPSPAAFPAGSSSGVATSTTVPPLAAAPVVRTPVAVTTAPPPTSRPPSSTPTEAVERTVGSSSAPTATSTDVATADESAAGVPGPAAAAQARPSRDGVAQGQNQSSQDQGGAAGETLDHQAADRASGDNRYGDPRTVDPAAVPPCDPAATTTAMPTPTPAGQPGPPTADHCTPGAPAQAPTTTTTTTTVPPPPLFPFPLPEIPGLIHPAPGG